jgi:subtilase-type serine protease
MILAVATLLGSGLPASALVLNDNFNGGGFTVINSASGNAIPSGIDSTNLFSNVVSLDAGGCTGTLINARTVVTAAHCFFNKDGTISPVETIGFQPVGSTLASTTVTPSMVIINPKYNQLGTSAADIAIIILPNAIKDITPATLMTANPGDLNFPGKGTPLLIVGYGGRGTGTNPPPSNGLKTDNQRRIGQTTLGGYMSAATLPGVTGTQNVFAAQFRDPANPTQYNYFNFTTGQAQVTTAEAGNAPGDSGGPVFYCPIGTGCTPSQLILMGTLIGGDQPGTGTSNGYGEVNSWTPINLFLSWLNGNNGSLSLTAKAGSGLSFTSDSAWTTGVAPGVNDEAWISNATTMSVNTNATVSSVWLSNSKASLTINAGTTLTATTGTMLNSGYLWVNGTLATPLLGLTGGFVQGTGTIDTSGGNVSNYAGTIAPGGSSTGTLRILGDYLHAPSATLWIKAGSNSSDQLAVSGTATLGGKVFVVIAAQGAPIVAGTNYDVLTANGLSGTVTATTASAFIGVTASYTTTAVNIALNRVNTYASAAETDNAKAYAAVLDREVANPKLSADMKNILSRLDGVNAAQAEEFYTRQAADGSDDDSDVIGNQLLANLATARLVQGALDQHLSTMRDGTAAQVHRAAGMGGLDFSYASRSGLGVAGAANGNPLAAESRTADNAFAAAPLPAQTATWLRAIGGWQSLKSDGNAFGLKTQTAGIVGGVDLNPLGEILPDLKTGVGFSYTRSALGGGSESGTTDTYRVSAYGTHSFGKAFLDGHASYGWSQMSSTRNLDVLGLSRVATGSTNGQEWATALNAGYRQMVGNYLFEPSAGFSYIHLTRNGYAESGAGALNLTYDNSAFDALRFSTGLRAQRIFALANGSTLRPELRVRYSYDARDVMPLTTATQEGLPGDPFSFEGVELGRHALMLGGGLTWANNRNLALFADYNVETRKYQTVQTAWGGMRISW